MTLKIKHLPRYAILLAALSAAMLNSGCVLLFGGAMVGTVQVATDRRTAGTQVEDEAIEFKAAAQIRDQLGSNVHVNVNAYNRVALITGEANTDADKAKLAGIVGGVENVTKVLDETEVNFSSSLTSRSNDVLIAGKIKATLIDAKDLISNAFYVVVERGNVYLMGRVTEREAKRATELVRGISGVNKVVRAFEIISEDELARLTPRPAPKQQ